jgi:hypothetical protein
MLEFCKVRWVAGHRSNINQMLLIVDYLSEDTNEVSFYVMRPGGDLKVAAVRLPRDPKSRITQLTFSPTADDVKRLRQHKKPVFSTIQVPVMGGEFQRPGRKPVRSELTGC